MIKTVDLHKSFKIEGQAEPLHVLKGVSEHIKKGEVVSIIGPSGGGKSTFLRCLNMLEVPEKGHIFFEGVDITAENVDINLHRQKMGMVFQHFNVFPHLSVAENITLAPVLTKKKTQAEANELAKELLARVGLLDKLNEHPGRLSGGQK
ncbi:MAG: amino acid ABC transporter ATP-binding protein, partial [Firmicutes bacterium]|nr:amino acid ABC transporter ATP-binding protein [Bacillota bacterium]